MFNYVVTDFVYNVLSGQELQRLKVESETKLQQREYNLYSFMRSMVGYMLLRNSLDTLGFEWSYLFYKEIRGYKASERILRPLNLVISSVSQQRIKYRISQKHISEIMSIYNESENHIKRTLNKLYGRENFYDS